MGDYFEVKVWALKLKKIKKGEQNNFIVKAEMISINVQQPKDFLF